MKFGVTSLFRDEALNRTLQTLYEELLKKVQ